jgi:hypothetical protein
MNRTYRVGLTVWIGFILIMMLDSFIRIAPGLPGAALALVTWPGILMLPFVLLLVTAVILSVVMFVTMMVFAWRDRSDR